MKNHSANASQILIQIMDSSQSNLNHSKNLHVIWGFGNETVAVAKEDLASALGLWVATKNKSESESESKSKSKSFNDIVKALIWKAKFPAAFAPIVDSDTEGNTNSYDWVAIQYVKWEKCSSFFDFLNFLFFIFFIVFKFLLL